MTEIGAVAICLGPTALVVLAAAAIASRRNR